MTRTYLTNRQLTERGYGEVLAPGFELVGVVGSLTVQFWHGFFVAGNIIDRVDGRPAQRRLVARIVPQRNGYAYTTLPGPKGAIRHGWAQTEEEAIAAVTKWVKRRFAHVSIPATQKGVA